MTKTISTGILCAASVFAQSQTDQIDKLKAELRDTAVFISTEGIPESRVVGAPYSADETNTTTQTLFDGNRIIHSSTSKVYRDELGRTRVERNLSGIGALTASEPLTRIAVNDPVANVMYTLDPEVRTAFKTSTGNGGNASQAATIARLKQMAEDIQKAKVKIEGVSPAASYSTMQKAERSTKPEDLGTSNMAGVPVKGTRSTLVIPAGVGGNDRDINIVDERWYSPDLKMNIMTKHSDPRSGETIFQVTNLTRANPEPSLFQVPADYQIKEGAQRAFRITTDKE